MVTNITLQQLLQCVGGEPRTLCEVLSHVEPHVQHTPAFVITFVLKVGCHQLSSFILLLYVNAPQCQGYAQALSLFANSIVLGRWAVPACKFMWPCSPCRTSPTTMAKS